MFKGVNDDLICFEMVEVKTQPSQIKIRPSDWKKLPFVGSQGPLPHYLIFTITNNINGASGTYDR